MIQYEVIVGEDLHCRRKDGGVIVLREELYVRGVWVRGMEWR